jgi:hypothetical protein
VYKVDQLKTTVAGDAMERFVREENLRLYRRALSETTDEVKRGVLRTLIALLEEDSRDKAHDR